MSEGWIENHGDKILSLIVVVMLYLQGQPDLFAFSPEAPLIAKWIAAIAAIGSLAHKTFYPQAPIPTAAMYRRAMLREGGAQQSTPGNRQ